MPTKQDFVTFLKTQPYWTDVWTEAELDNWAKGTEGSHNLDEIYAQFVEGNALPAINYVFVESGHNLQNPMWVNWGQTGIKPEVIALQNMITDLNNRLNQYTSVGGSNTALIGTIKSEIASLNATLKQYDAAPGATS